MTRELNGGASGEPCRDPHSGGRIFSIFKALKENLPRHYAINLRVLHAGDESFKLLYSNDRTKSRPIHKPLPVARRNDALMMPGIQTKVPERAKSSLKDLKGC